MPAELPEGGVHNQGREGACSCVSEAVSGQAHGEVRLGKDNLGEDISGRKIQAEIPEKPLEAGGLVKQFLILRIWNMADAIALGRALRPLSHSRGPRRPHGRADSCD